MKHQVRLYNQLVTRFNRYRRKLQRIESGECHYERKGLLLKRISQLYGRLTYLRTSLKLATASAALTLTFSVAVPTAYGQGLVMKTDKASRHAHVENDAKPVFTDIDGDGDMDLFIGGKLETQTDVKASGMNFYLNNGGLLSNAASPFPDSLNINPALGDTARVSPAFVDWDGDNDMDAFIGLSDSTIIYYRNDGGTMVGVIGAGNPFDGVKIGDFNASPVFVNFDGDGDMDAVVGKYTGGLEYYENDGAGNLVAKTGADNPFDAINVTESAAPTFADIDGDLDLDLFVGNKEGSIAYFENNNGVFTEVSGAGNPFSSIAAGSIGEHLAPAFADIDADGDLDAFFGNDDGLVEYFRNDAGTFTQIPDNPLGITNVGTDPNHSFADLDGDGDMDIFAGMGDGFIEYFRNDGGTFTRQDSANNPLNIGVFSTEFFAAPAFADIDGDLDLDAFIGTYDEDIVYLRNDAGVFVADSAGNPFDGIDQGFDESLVFVDWDNDSDLDAFIGNKDGQIKYYVNDLGVFSESAAIDNPFDGVDFAVPGQSDQITRPAFADLDGDADMDAVIGTTDGKLRYFENDGAGALTEKTGADNPFNGWDFGRNISPDFGDVDGDGDMDMVLAEAKGITYYFENTGSTAIDKELQSAQTRAYPNPTTGLLQIDMPWNSGNASIQVTNLSGQSLMQHTASGTIASIAMETLPAGMYLVTITSDQGRAVKKVVKQ
jgi:hypothetical protein